MGGFGAAIKGDFHLVAGQVLRIIVGQKGTSGGSSLYAGSGGGASAVSVNNESQPLIVAGGGGGASRNNTDISPGAGLSQNNGDTPGLWGINRDNGNDSHPGGSGASWSKNGKDGSGPRGSLSTNRIGIALNGTAYGGDPVRDNENASVGGFGGGGSGGGYSGGNGGRYDGISPKNQGDGGGSFNAGENQNNIRGGNNRIHNGYVTITFVDNNNPPTKPLSFITQPHIDSKNLSNESIHLSWSPSSDLDGDAIVYKVEFYNGTDWNTVLSDLSQTSCDFILPNLNVENAQIRVSAIDSKGLSSEYLVSNVFSIQKTFLLVRDNDMVKTFKDGVWKAI